MANATIREFISLLSIIAVEATKDALEVQGKNIVNTAKEMIGTERAEWPELAEGTIKEKERLGFTNQVSATDPLLRTGEYRDSFSCETHGPFRAEVGTTDPHAPSHELGTYKEPPRPVLGPASMKHEMDAAEHIILEMKRLLRG